MITREDIVKFVEEKIAKTDIFIVDIAIKPGNRILVEIDRPQGINISNCTTIHRFIESKLNRDIEDFELTVSSPGLEEPFKMLKQYQKNIGRDVKIVLRTGIVAEGELIKADESGIEIVHKTKEKINGKKQISTKQITITFEQIKTTRLK